MLVMPRQYDWRRIGAFLVLVLSLNTQAELFAGLGQTIHYFPQFAIGGGSTTFFNIYNNNDQEILVNLTFYRSDGTLFLSDTRTVAAHATLVAEYGGAAGVPVDGWVAVSSLQPFAASLYFAIEGVGNVGVPSSAAVSDFQFFSFHSDQSNTGFAIANPNPEQTVLNFRFFNSSGQLQGTADVMLPAMGHLADFVDESPYNFGQEGRVEVSSENAVIAVTLRSEGAFLTSAPILTPAVVPGFSDWERIIFSSDVTMPANDTALVQATCPEGKRVLGGGGWSSGNNAILVDSWPVPPGERIWTAIFWNHREVEINTTIRAYAICATAP